SEDDRGLPHEQLVELVLASYPGYDYDSVDSERGNVGPAWERRDRRWVRRVVDPAGTDRGERGLTLPRVQSLLEARQMRRRYELRELAVAMGAGMGGTEAINQALPEVAEKLSGDGFENENWWETFGPS